MKHTIIENEPEIKLQNDLNHHIEISPNTKPPMALPPPLPL